MFFLRGKINLGVKLITHPYLVPNLKITGDLPLLSRVTSFHTLGQRYL